MHSQIIYLTCKKGYYSHYFNKAENVDYVGPSSEPKLYGADYMSHDERAQFLEWYENKRTIFLAISKSSWPTAWIMSMYWGMHAVHLGIVFEFDQNGPFSASYKNIVNMQ